MKKLKGSLTIEAALVLPIFLFAIFSIIYFVKIIYIHERVQHAITEAAEEMSIGAYILESSGLIDLQQGIYNKASDDIQTIQSSFYEIDEILNGLTNISINQEDSFLIETPEFKNVSKLSEDILFIKNQIEIGINFIYSNLNNLLGGILAIAEDSSQIIISSGVIEGMEIINNVIGTKIARSIVSKHISAEDYYYWGVIGGEKGFDYSGSQFLLKDDDIFITISYQVEMPFLKEILKPLSITQAVKIRAYTGNGNLKILYKNKEDRGNIVYITRNGTKYHTEKNCRYIDVKIKLSTYVKVKGSKSICEVCAKKNVCLNDFSAVYTTDSSNIFHIDSNCWTIKRYVSEILLEEALEKGYTHCSKCKGGKEE